MSEAPTLLLAWLAGGFLGAVFFGGLWWTVRKGASSPRPALWFFGSGLVRMSLTLAGFYFASGGHWQRLLPCLLGFVMARMVVLRLTRLPAGNSPRPVKEASHAP